MFTRTYEKIAKDHQVFEDQNIRIMEHKQKSRLEEDYLGRTFQKTIRVASKR